MQRILSTVCSSVFAVSAAMSLAGCDPADESLEALLDDDADLAEDEQNEPAELSPPKSPWKDDLVMAPPSPHPFGLNTPSFDPVPADFAAFAEPHIECICTDEQAPVCGVDGETYQNSCAAICSGVEIEHDGACDDDACVCTLEYDPVCGVDGETYGNACAAGCADVDIDHEGTCEASTCTSDEECGPLGFCQRDAVCAGPGTCEAKPDACLDKSSAVCGCDGRVYDSPCMAHVYGVSVGPDDACEIEGEPRPAPQDPPEY